MHDDSLFDVYFSYSPGIESSLYAHFKLFNIVRNEDVIATADVPSKSKYAVWQNKNVKDKSRIICHQFLPKRSLQIVRECAKLPRVIFQLFFIIPAPSNSIFRAF